MEDPSPTASTIQSHSWLHFTLGWVEQGCHFRPGRGRNPPGASGGEERAVISYQLPVIRYHHPSGKPHPVTAGKCLYLGISSPACIAGCRVSCQEHFERGRWGDAGAEAQTEENGGCCSLSFLRFWPCECPTALPRLRMLPGREQVNKSQHSLS